MLHTNRQPHTHNLQSATMYPPTRYHTSHPRCYSNIIHGRFQPLHMQHQVPPPAMTHQPGSRALGLCCSCLVLAAAALTGYIHTMQPYILRSDSGRPTEGQQAAPSNHVSNSLCSTPGVGASLQHKLPHSHSLMPCHIQ